MFTAAEQTEIGRLVNAGISARASLHAIEMVLPVATTEATRPALAAAMHPLLEVSEGASNALSFLSGAIAVRGEAEKPAARLWDRAHFLVRAYAELDGALHEAEEGSEHLSELAAAIPGNAIGLDGVRLATNHLRRAVERLTTFNRKLPYADPLAWGDIDPVLQRDVQTNLYRASGQYLYDALEVLLEAYAMDPPILAPNELGIMRDALGWGWLAQDDMAKQTARLLGMQWVKGENPIQVAFWESIARTSPRLQFCLTYAARLGVGAAAAGRPQLAAAMAFVAAKGSDAWKRFDYFLGLLPVMARWMPAGKPFGTTADFGPVDPTSFALLDEDAVAPTA